MLVIKSRVDFCNVLKPSRSINPSKEHNFETNRYQAKGLVFAENQPIKIGTILKQMAHHMY